MKRKLRWIIGTLIAAGIAVIIVGLTRPLVLRSYKDPLMREVGILRSLQ